MLQHSRTAPFTDVVAGTTTHEVTACARLLLAEAMWAVVCEWRSGAFDREPTMKDVYDRLTADTG
jgi:hypothetical protein